VNLHALEQIIALSDSYGFDVILVQGVYPTGFHTDYAAAAAIGEKYGIPVYLLNQTHAAEYTSLDFVDPNHLNANGAILASITLAEILSKEMGRELDQDVINRYAQLHLKAIQIESSDGQTQVTLHPAVETAVWQVEWTFYVDTDQIAVSAEGEALSFTFPTALLQKEKPSLAFTITQQGLSYPLQLVLRPVDFWEPTE
jgi:hypothetical protein